MSTAVSEHGLDLEARYSVAGYGGIAFYLTGYATTVADEGWTLLCEDEECDHQLSQMCWLYDEPEEIEDPQFVKAVMVGDDTEHIVDVDDLTVISEEDYCSGCGQIGCGAWS